LAGATLPGSTADAAFPGGNGKIAYSHAGDIWTVNPDGAGAVQITTHPARDLSPAWSPDGKRIAFLSTRADPNPATCSSCIWEIEVMDADGTDVHPVLAGQPPSAPASPVWSPDGTRIAFARSFSLWSVAVDGTDERQVTGSGGNCSAYHGPPVAWSSDGTRLTSNGSLICFEHEFPGSCIVTIATRTHECQENGGAWTFQDWSPDAARVLVGSDGSFYGLHTLPVDGGDRVFLTPEGQGYDGYDDNAAWSPDGTTIVFRRESYDGSVPSRVYLIDSGGGNMRPFDGPHHAGCCFDWQPIPINAYPRPKGASPVDVPLVPAYDACTTPNRTHGPPLGFGSCAPPVRSSGALTIGTADSNGSPTTSNSRVKIGALPGDPQTPADEADLRLSGSVNDVRVASDLSLYKGSLEARVTVRITDRDNTPHPGGPGAGTTQDIAYSFPIPCAAGDCTFFTTAEAFVPGLVTELRRSVWELGAVRVHDGAGNLFMRQGVFVP
jgi:hypothetical protein